MRAMSLDCLPPFDRAALLLDLDGTLLDIAPRPDAVVVAPGLLESLHSLRDRLGGGVAIVTGRTADVVDRLLGAGEFALAAEHGGTVRYAPGEALERADSHLPTPPAEWIEATQRLAAAHPGAIMERKALGFTLHYRAVPEAGPAFRDALLAMLAGSLAFELLPGHMLWEVRPRGVDKGTAVRALMACAPFAGRLPVFIGDDVTDEDGMRVTRAMGGAGLQVAPAFGSAGGVRGWLAEAAKRGEWPELPWRG
jgi:trehalose 6-phosphate phosphatase